MGPPLGVVRFDNRRAFGDVVGGAVDVGAGCVDGAQGFDSDAGGDAGYEEGFCL